MHEFIRVAHQRSSLLAEYSAGPKKLLLGSSERIRLERSNIQCPPSNSDLEIRYRGNHPLLPFTGTAREKPFIRFDFEREWNNRGYGEITMPSDSPWSLSGLFVAPEDATVLASVFDSVSDEKICDYAFILDTKSESKLWFNRAVGPIDGYDWVIVENFYSDYRANELPCYPVAQEVPAGFDSAVTMRIDCDEAVASGRELFELYSDFRTPFGLAVKTKQSLGVDDQSLMQDVIQAGGTVCSHSHTHAPNWGGSRASAAQEIKDSHAVLRDLKIDGINYDYVVSPFHQNSVAAVEGLRDAGIKGFVSGIICNDPEFLMARAGQVPFVDGIISHSQQCMFHGDTYHAAGGSLAIYEQAFKQAKETRTFFGYLDHPLSGYNYGWQSEEERLFAHRSYLEFLALERSCWKASLEQAMSFLEMKSSIKVSATNNLVSMSLKSDPRFEKLPAVVIRHRGENHTLVQGGEVSFEAKS